MNVPTRAPHQLATSQQSHAPNAALLIDFDNVTMGIRSDLTRELRNLLDSEVIRGKVAVQRAYADWRRYPQYIVPLSEASIDLIFAPAYGSSKKNATDIRLAIDALELVFTRPEIGTFMLLSGDSDFSSLVLKLKEYGKYVIGVGIRESASDLLVQNCDEYYSYSALTGLTAADDDAGERHDPWELVERAVLRMEKNGDVMRSDRLKQVMIEMDPGFDEKELGFTKYNKFLTEAAGKNRLSLIKLENGQFEVSPAGRGGGAGSDGDERKPRGRGRGRERGRRGGRRDEGGRDEGPAAESPAAESPQASRPQASPARPERAPERDTPPRDDVTSTPEPRSAETEGGAAPEGQEADAFRLLARAVRDLGEGGNVAVRDSELKRRMLQLDEGWDEATLGFSKFSRFLRRAHDEEVIDLNRTPEGHYEAVLGRKASAYSTGGVASGRGRETPARSDGDPGRSDAGPGRSDGRAGQGRGAREARSRESAAPPAAATVATVAAEDEPAQVPVDGGGRAPASAQPDAGRGAAAATARPGGGWGRGRGRAAPSGPPPVLPGQTVGPSGGGATGSAGGRGGGEAFAAARPAGAPPDGLPDERAEVIRYLVSRYKGVGERTATTVVDAFGPGEVFRILDEDPERVRDLVGPARAQMLIAGWEADAEARAGR